VALVAEVAVSGPRPARLQRLHPDGSAATPTPTSASVATATTSLPVWQPHFCVLLQDEQTLTAYRSEELAVSRRAISPKGIVQFWSCNKAVANVFPHKAEPSSVIRTGQYLLDYKYMHYMRS